MNVNGIDSNYYLTDNPIFVNLSNIRNDTTYVTIFARDLKTQNVSQPLRYYPILSQTTGSSIFQDMNIDIAPLVKSMMDEPDHNRPSLQAQQVNTFETYLNSNILNLEITFRERVNDQSFYDTKRTKIFIRGGKRTYESNQNLSFGDILSPTPTIPRWSGYPINYYYIGKIDSGATGIVQNSIVPPEIIKNQKVKGCNPQYVKFLNSLGGYSYWLFENWETEDRNSNLGYIPRREEVLDLGNEFESGIKLTSKVKKEFLPLIKDLIVSEEIYLYDQSTQKYTRISSNRNRVRENPFSVNYKVDLNFVLYNRYKPSVLW